ncbi:hypothetical protein R9X47_06200 [Wukongibacter baidiensis]|uniref:hypothetical protein n=1 Tax=Wukongibacter baidiensis TaxID=1723361 RepID=UPI003D7F3716
MKINFFDKTNIDKIEFNDALEQTSIRDYFMPLIKEGTKKYISNVETEINLLKIDDEIIPLTINEKEYTNSYVASIYTHYISYLAEELRILKSRLIYLLAAPLIYLVGFFFKLLKVNKIVCVNNWLISTNLHRNISKEKLSAIHDGILSKYNKHAIIYRSLNEFTNMDMMNSLEGLDYIKIPSRQVFILDRNKKLKRRQREHLRRDSKMISKNDLKIVDANSEKFASRFVELYNSLYLDKYSKLNPMYSMDYFKLAARDKFYNLKLIMYKDEIKAFYGYFNKNGVMTTPLFGYDTSLAKEVGLYRVLSYLLYEESIKYNFAFHESSGVGDFKINRGAEKYIEYSYVYIKHLPLYRRLPYLFLSKLLNRFILPIFKNKNF